MLDRRALRRLDHGGRLQAAGMLDDGCAERCRGLAVAPPRGSRGGGVASDGVVLLTVETSGARGVSVLELVDCLGPSLDSIRVARRWARNAVGTLGYTKWVAGTLGEGGEGEGRSPKKVEDH